MRKLCAPVFLLGAVMAGPISVRAETGLPDEASVAAAIAGHPAVAAAEARIGSAQAEERALARGPHEFSLSAGYTSRSVDREGRFDEYDAVLSRAVRLPGKARMDREIGRYGVIAATNLAEDARHQVALQLAQDWWDWLGSAEEARVDRQAVENYTATLAAVQRRVALRDAAQLEADQAQAALAAARLVAEQSAGREAVARARLSVRFPSLALPQVPPQVPVPQLPEGGLDGTGDRIIERSHEIAAAEALAARSGARAERVRQDRLADPSLGVRVFSERAGAERGAGLVLSMPLGGGHRRALADQAAAEALAARAEATAARRGVEEMARTDMAEARYRIDAWARAREGVSAQVASLAKLRRGQAAGEIGLADVLFAERQVHDAFRAEAAARTAAMHALTRLRIDSHELWISE